MKTKAWFKRNWFGILGVIIGFLIACYFYSKSIIIRDPIFIVDSSRTEILNSARISQSPVKVIKQNGEEIKSDLTAVKFYFWNSGKAPIKKSDILNKISIILDDPNGEIIETRILKTSREITNIRLRSSKDNPSRSVDIDFSILEYKDGMTGQIIFAGQPKTNLVISGIIEGAGEIRSTESLAFSMSRPDFQRYAVYIVLSIFGFILLIYFIAFLEKRVIIPMKSMKIQISEKMQNLIAILIFASIFFVLIYMFVFKGGISEVKRSARESLVDIVPRNIIPSGTLP